MALPSGAAAYCDDGSGPVVVALHGLPGSSRDFRWLAPCFSGAMRLLRVDFPGFGATPLGPGSESVEARVAFVAQFLDALEIDRAVVIGHSMGGVVACAFAELHPTRTAGIVLISAPGLRKHRMVRRMNAERGSRWLRSRMGPALTPLMRRAFRAAGFPPSYRDDELRLTIHSVAALDFDAHARRVRRLATPTAVVWCDDDPIVEADIPPELAAQCPEGPRLRFPTGGHNPQKHRAVELADAIVPWATRLLRGADDA